jgi:hypothetical protein
LYQQVPCLIEKRRIEEGDASIRWELAYVASTSLV